MDEKEIINWFKEQPKPDEIKTNLDGSQYLSIGTYETLLDELTNYKWDTEQFKFQIIRIDKYWFADASCVLMLYLETGLRSMTGAVTFQISSRDSNMDYSATALSFCIANACKRIALRFGRGLNNRLTVGDVLPVIKVEKSVPIDEEKRRAQLLIEQATDIEKLQKEWYPLAKSKKLMPVYNKKLRELKKLKELSNAK